MKKSVRLERPKRRARKNPLPGVYKIVCSGNAKVYVGSSVDMRGRELAHFSGLRLGKHHSNHMQNAYNKYGDGSMTFVIIEIVDDVDQLVIREQYYIDMHKSADRECGFNILPIAYSGRGFKHSDQSKKKISKSKIGTKRTIEGRRNIALGNLSVSVEIVIEIRELLKTGVTQKSIAKKFGIDPSAVSRIHTGDRYRLIGKEVI